MRARSGPRYLPSSTSRGPIIRCTAKHGGQPVALGDEGVAHGAQTRDPAGHDREREELSRLALAPLGMLEIIKSKNSAKGSAAAARAVLENEETDEPGDGALHARGGAASALGNRTLKKAPIAKTRTTKSTEIPAR